MTKLALLALLGCPKPVLTDGPADVGDRPLVADADKPVSGTLTLVESWPVETSLDQPDLPDAWQVWPEMIDGAQSHLDIAQFYVSPDPDAEDRMDTVLASVEQAASRGVNVRLLADAKFQKTYPDDIARLGALDNIELRILDLKPVTGGVLHAKYFLVDSREAYLGSQNWDYRSLEHIQELGLRFDGPMAVAGLQHVFDEDWATAAGETAEPSIVPMASRIDAISENLMWGKNQVGVQFVASPKQLTLDGVWDLPHLLRMIEGAQTSVRVQLLNYAVVGYDKSEWRELDDALRAAGSRGVDVRMLVSNWQKSKYKQGVVKELTQADGVTVKFVNIPEHSGGWIDFGRTIHSKYLVVDEDKSWVGTSNWSRDYFHGSRNVGLIVSSDAFAIRLNDLHQFMWDSEYAEPVDPEQSYMAPYEERKAKQEEGSGE